MSGGSAWLVLRPQTAIWAGVRACGVRQAPRARLSSAAVNSSSSSTTTAAWLVGGGAQARLGAPAVRAPCLQHQPSAYLSSAAATRATDKSGGGIFGKMLGKLTGSGDDSSSTSAKPTQEQQQQQADGSVADTAGTADAATAAAEEEEEQWVEELSLLDHAAPPPTPETVAAFLQDTAEMAGSDEFPSLARKCEVLRACVEEFGIDVPNPRLSGLTTAADVVAFFSSPALERLRPRDLPLFARLRETTELPPNLTIDRC